MRAISPEKLVVVSAWVSRLASAFVSVFSLRVLSSNLTAAEYATFVIIVGVSGWYSLFGDPGIGYATQNTVTRRRALDEDPGSDVLVAYGMLAAATTCVALVTLGLSDRVSPLLLSNISDSSAGMHGSTLWWSGVIFAAGAAAGASSKLLYAVHRGYIANVTTAAASLLGFVILSKGLTAAESKVVFAVFALYGPALLFSLVLAALQIKASWRARYRINRKDTLVLLKEARWFLLFNAVAAAVLQIDYIIMSQKVAPLEIVQYYNIAKLFALSAFLNQAIMFAFWPRFTEQFAKGQTDEISRSIHRLIIYGAVLALGTTVIVMLASNALSALLSPGTPIEFRHTVIAGFGALALARCVTDPNAIFLQSIGRVKPLIAFAALQAVIGGSLQWILSDYFGVEGILFALVLSFMLTVGWGLPLTARISLSNVHRR